MAIASMALGLIVLGGVAAFAVLGFIVIITSIPVCAVIDAIHAFGH